MTRREEDVTALVLRGYTDKEVAAELFLTAKTVEFNLRNIYAKLGITSRQHRRRIRSATARVGDESAGCVLLALVPLRRVRLAPNLLVAAGTIFLAIQLVLVHRPPSDAVTIGAPLADPWWVGQGGRAELINYHHTGADAEQRPGHHADR